METVFIDVDTQYDFLFPAGALYVPGAERLIPAFARLNRFAGSHSIPVISTTDAHSENDPEFRQWPGHCVLGTAGQRKPEEVLLEKRVVAPAAAEAYRPEGAAQIIVEKRHIDLFAEPNLQTIVETLDARRCVVYGVVTEYCVRSAALGFLDLGKEVELVTDAVKALKQEDERRTLEEFTRRGGRLTTVEEVCRRQ